MSIRYSLQLQCLFPILIKNLLTVEMECFLMRVQISTPSNLDSESDWNSSLANESSSSLLQSSSASSTKSSSDSSRLLVISHFRIFNHVFRNALPCSCDPRKNQFLRWFLLAATRCKFMYSFCHPPLSNTIFKQLIQRDIQWLKDWGYSAGNYCQIGVFSCQCCFHAFCHMGFQHVTNKQAPSPPHATSPQMPNFLNLCFHYFAIHPTVFLSSDYAMLVGNLW